MTEKPPELWEDRFGILCEELQINETDWPTLYKFLRDGFADGYAWGAADTFEGLIK